MIIGNEILNFRFNKNEWKFIDFRIDIPEMSKGSDAINPHTQYSNPISETYHDGFQGIGASFTLGLGNDLLCKCAKDIITLLDGYSIEELVNSSKGFYETITNPLQLRWLSPYSGIVLMSAGMIVNTVFDWASKKASLPLWEYVSRLDSDIIIKLLNIRHLGTTIELEEIKNILDDGLIGIDERIDLVKQSDIPVYHTTWYGESPKELIDQITALNEEKGISLFKLKIGNDINSDIKKIDEVINNLPNSISLAVDANQTHTIHESKKYVLALEKRNILWFEEPFAPDNIILFEDLVNYCKNNQLNIEIVTGENCPNPQTAIGLFKSGINRFQADPCRMLGFLDNIIMCILCRIFGISIMPHAGGSGLDEMSLHISIFNYMRVVPNENICHSLTENVGFCSHLFSQPTLVKNGVAKTPYMPGYLVGMSESVSQIMKKFEDGITWVKL